MLYHLAGKTVAYRLSYYKKLIIYHHQFSFYISGKLISCTWHSDNILIVIYHREIQFNVCIPDYIFSTEIFKKQIKSFNVPYPDDSQIMVFLLLHFLTGIDAA